MEIQYIQSKDVFAFGKIAKQLLPEFGPAFCQTVLEWCEVIPDNFDNYWKWFLICDNSKAIGCCGLYSLDKNTDELWLSWFGIIPEYRNKGIGKQSLAFLEKLATIDGCKIIRSYVDKEGKPLGFYMRNGFNVTGRVRDFLEANKMKQIDGDNFEDMADFIIEKPIKRWTN